MTDQIIPPPTAPVRLIQVGLTESAKGGGRNKFYHMTPDGAEFIAEWGRVGSTPDTKRYPISSWNKIYREKCHRKKDPYKDVTYLAAVTTKKTKHVDIKEPKVADLFSRLLKFSKASVAENYTISSDAVTEAQVKEAQGFVDELVKMAKVGTDQKRANELLLELYMAIPRRMARVKDHLIPSDIQTKDDLQAFRTIIDTEQNTLDVMAGQVKMAGNDVASTDTAPTQTILDVLGLEVEIAPNIDIAMVKALMQGDARELKAVYRARHAASFNRFDKFVKSATNRTILPLWHGSRNENWISILQTGLMIRPAGAILSGSAFGDGIYGADKYRKSAGYTSLSGSYWAGGSSKTAFLAVMNFHVGKQYETLSGDSSLSSEKLQKMGGYDSTFAKTGPGGWLKNNEYIVYQTPQVTITHLVEVGN